MDHVRLAGLVAAGDAAGVAAWVDGLDPIQEAASSGPGVAALLAVQACARARSEQMEAASARAGTVVAALEPLPRTAGIAVAAGAVTGGAFWLLGDIAIAIAAVAWIVAGKLVWRPGRARTQLDLGPQDQALLTACKRLVALNFVEDAGGRVVENTPNRTLLAARRADLRDAQAAIHDKTAALVALRAQVERANQELGRSGPDPDLERLDREQADLGVHHRRLRALDKRLQDELERYDQGLDTLRAWARRAALSERLGRTLDGAHEHAKLAAELEVDLLDVERSFADLEIDLGRADASLRTALELG